MQQKTKMKHTNKNEANKMNPQKTNMKQTIKYKRSKQMKQKQK